MTSWKLPSLGNRGKRCDETKVKFSIIIYHGSSYQMPNDKFSAVRNFSAYAKVLTTMTILTKLNVLEINRLIKKINAIVRRHILSELYIL